MTQYKQNADAFVNRNDRKEGGGAARQVEMFRRIFKIISHLSAKSDQENERERMSGSAMAVQRVSERARGRRERARERAIQSGP